MLDIFPQDEYSLFDDLIEQAIDVAAIGVTPLVGIDPTRVTLVLSLATSPGQAAIVSTSKSGTSGIYLASPYANAQVFTYKLHGRLVTSAWYAWVPAGGPATKVTVITGTMMRPPELYGYDTVFKKANSVVPANTASVGRDTRAVRGYLRTTLLPRALRERLPGILGEG
jgi:hypothetical protein